MSKLVCVPLLLATLFAAAGCGRALRATPSPTPGAPPLIHELWVEPADLATRDLFHGPGGRTLQPSTTAFEFLEEDTRGFSPGFDVRDDRGLEWSVKTGPEAQSEVVASRVLWAIGYHQPPTYYLADWRLRGARTGAQAPGRFRPKLPHAKVKDNWSFWENPFVGTRPFHGLIVANLMLTNWDWKSDNNKIYEIREAGAPPRREYVVRDLGAALGKFTYPHVLRFVRLRGFGQGTRNDLAGFEEQGFIKSMNEQDVDFHYRGIYRDVVNSVTPADVVWASRLLNRLSDAQWNDAFRAAGYTPDQSARYIRKIKSKIAQGLASPQS